MVRPWPSSSCSPKSRRKPDRHWWSSMTVVRLLLAYDGTDFHGWARQPGVRTIEGVLEESLARLLGQAPRVSVAGRTDAGVHAEGQVVSFAAPDQDPGRIQRGLNGMRAPEVVVRH